jgi:Flp pilus assembly protein TadG
MGGTQITFRRLRRVSGDSRGAAAVELGLVLGILMLLLFGIIEFGLVLNRYITVTHASREGVRQLSVIPGDSETAKALAIAKAKETAPDLNQVGNISCEASIDTSVREVAMTCTTKYDLSLWVIRKPLTVSSTSTMRKE